MRQDPSNPYVFYTAPGERITIRVKGIKTSPLVEGAGPPGFTARPADPKTNTRVFEFTEANPADVDAVRLKFNFIGTDAKAKYAVTLSGDEGGGEATIPPIKKIPGSSLRNLAMLFMANPEAQP